MPPIEMMDMLQTAVVWQALARANRKGETQVGEPEEIPVRWTWGRSQTIDARGNHINIDANAVVDQSIPLGSLIALGKLEDWLDVGTAPISSLSTLNELMVVVTYREVTDIKHRPEQGHIRRRLGLRRYKDVLTNVVES